MARNPLAPSRSGFGLFGAGDPFLSLHREMNRLFDDVLRGSGLPGPGQDQGGTGSFVTASMNVSETDEEIRVTAELPGVTDQDIDVSLNDDVLTIRGEKKFERKDEKENFHFVERTYGTFQRSLRLPYPVDPERVRASFDNGVLTVTVPKTGQQQRSRRIQIEGGGTRTEAGQPAQAEPTTGGKGGARDKPGSKTGG